MCGLFGIAAAGGRSVGLTDRQFEALRDRLAHRGPDAAGVWRAPGGGAALGHRRLIVIDPSPEANQPMRSPALSVTDDPEGRFVLVYNGELYNDAELRREMSTVGVTFRTRSDTETVLLALMLWGTGALRRLRGMFALALYDTRANTLLLARDPLGIKPLYFRADEKQLIFASEVGAIQAHPDVPSRPNMAMVSAYLTTIRTVLGNATMYEGIHSLAPGQMAMCDLSGASPSVRVRAYGPRHGSHDAAATSGRGDAGSVARRVRRAVEESVRLHLRADVPTCALLSGGLDSTITATLAREHAAHLRTYAAGCPVPAHCADDAANGDLAFARRVASLLGTDHAEAHVTREVFAERWPWMIERMGVPLSTPNEVAIHTVASRLREDGCIVTISGEGADELFGGYEIPLSAAAAYLSSPNRLKNPGRFEIENACWISPELKMGVLQPRVWESVVEDAWLLEFAEREFEAALEETGGEHTLETHLRMQRQINLTGLLQRLDTATMLAGVEGRTPFADVGVLAAANGTPMEMKFAPAGREEGEHAGEGGQPYPAQHAGGAAVATRAAARTKIALREAFADRVPGFVLERPKASFPLPFQQWLRDHVHALRESAFAREVFNPAAIEAVRREPAKLWHLAWPMVNVAMWMK